MASFRKQTNSGRWGGLECSGETLLRLGRRDSPNEVLAGSAYSQAMGASSGKRLQGSRSHNSPVKRSKIVLCYMINRSNNKLVVSDSNEKAVRSTSVVEILFRSAAKGDSGQSAEAAGSGCN